MENQEKVNIYRVLNEFNSVFGEKPISIKPSMVSESHIFIKMIYNENVNIPANHIENDWNQFAGCGKNCGMAKIWVTRNERTKVPEFILWHENIYINRHLMPDRDKAQRFCEAVRKFSGDCLAGLMLSQKQVTMSNRMLQQFIDMSMEKIERLKEKISKESNVKELQQHIKELDLTIETLRILQEEKELRSNM